MLDDAEYRKPLLDNLWKSSLTGLAIVDESGKFKHANPAFCRITEYAETELQTRTFQEITHPDDLKADVALANEVSRDERVEYDMRKRYLTKTGKVVWILLRVTRLQKPDGHFEFFIAQIAELDTEGFLPGQDIVVRPPSALVEFFRDNWKALLVVGSAAVFLLAEFIKFMKVH